MTEVYHISDIKKFMRCRSYFIYDRIAVKGEFQPFVRLDEEITMLAADMLGIRDAFKGARGDDPAKALEAMKEKEWLIKARFEYGGLRIKVPFLHRTGNGWDLYFLFAGLFPRADDITYYTATCWVLDKLNIDIDNISVIHLNRDYERQDELDTKEMFIISSYFYNGKNNPTVPVQDALVKSWCDYAVVISQMDSCVHDQAEPVRTSRCTGRRKCNYYDICFPNEKEENCESITTLIASQHKYQMKNEGLLRLRDADPERIEGSRQQYAQIMADRNGGLFADRLALRSWLSYVKYPVTFLDFEWERFAIPPYRGMHPYDVLLFEYSTHVLYEDGRIDHNVFLSIHDDRRELTESLLADIPETGTVVAYNAEGAEKIRISELMAYFPEYADRLASINERMEDLQIPFETGTVYDTRMRGTWSLKTVMALLDDSSYRDLDINEGMQAVFQWRHLDYMEDEENSEKIIEDLKAYCGMDSYAMLAVFRWLKKIAG